MSVFSNVITPQGLEPLQFPTKFRSHSTREVLWDTIGATVPRYQPAECRNYFRHCGYSAATGL